MTMCITSHSLNVSGVSSETPGTVRRQEQTDDRSQRTEAKQDATTSV